jgi:succinoglycan biosynthesis protein ExoM
MRAVGTPVREPQGDIDASAVTVCICTFRRTSIVSTLQSVVAQGLPQGVSCGIIVVDNNIDRTAEPLILNFRAATNVEVEYVHAPAQNISIARNAGMTACKTRWLAFLDDDEIASVRWLDRLLAHRANASAVFGPSEAIYAAKTRKWISIGDFHSNRIIVRRGIVESGYTSNVLIDMNFVHRHRLRFNEQLGRTGGEDTIFFAAMRQLGGRFAYAPEAIAHEIVSSEKTSLNWVVKRRYRAGQITSMMQQMYHAREYQLSLLQTPIKILYCVGTAALLVLLPRRAMWWLMRAVFHFGILSYRIGGKVYEEYSVSKLDQFSATIRRR